MFADWVRQHLHPIWTPIFIRLRDITAFEQDIQKTLQNAVQADFAKNDSGWLTDKNTRYLFLLDGFDELRMEKRTASGVEEFLKQVGQFQKDCSQSSEMGHRVIITGRSTALLGIERFLPSNLERVEIEPMDEGLQQEWFDRWKQANVKTFHEMSLQNPTEKVTGIKSFLQNQTCPNGVRELAREPLLLYLLAAMYRDGTLETGMFTETSATKAKILVYEKSLEWVLTKQREEWLTQELTEQDFEGLRCILIEAGLAVVQAGGEYAPISMIESRLNRDSNTKELLEKAQKRLDDKPLRNALASFYIRTGSKEGSVEFTHKSYGEFLCAKRLQEYLEDWSLPGQRRNQTYAIPDQEMQQQIYDLFGATALTPEIVGYLMTLLTEEQPLERDNVIRLFERLKDFYFRWCEGEFIDASPLDNFPQKTMLLLKEQLSNREKSLGLRQVDVYTGLNVMILLLELHRYGQSKGELKNKIYFHPCGQPNTKEFEEFRLLRIISYNDCLNLRAFLEIVSSFLKGANLSGANLSGANLSGANLSGANLSGANLRGANLRGADFSGTDLSGANLSHANLSHANLSHADLRDADLSSADLSSADLSSADLSSADLSHADFSSANLRDTDLRSANLRSADLSSADLRGANLSSTYLSSTYLSRANLSYADLSGAYLRDADLSYADLSGAYLSNTKWNDATYWDYVQGLETAINVPEELKRRLRL